MVSMDTIIDTLIEIGGEATSVDLRDIIGCRLSDVSTKLKKLSDQGYLTKYPVEGKRGYVTVYVIKNNKKSDLETNSCVAVTGSTEHE